MTEFKETELDERVVDAALHQILKSSVAQVELTKFSLVHSFSFFYSCTNLRKSDVL